ncbi:MAG: DUF502 domain-containing protein [Bosea sp. (in: a-proteobacteria)]|uniref:DUF502 domain-containing protein n=1 Tax=unclassified Bosea (in: a-proteobacteria) TaxID=2653178 RepID=UPI00095AD186|nr:MULTISPECIES: DUF502 domain-containing protein [unclassified Bosea (in: a-proteobacteria)]MBN9457439.1 DUF502 domain-containing protein [Bosea sp. (in: a-proteobacteria)]OJV09586.1 MAG: hypothetical protein BGO20_02620 [Bosea sp. 67-29]
MTSSSPDPRLVIQPDLLRPSFGTRLRRYFFTGLVLAAPLAITASVTWWFVNLIDGWVKPLIPSAYLPDAYLPFPLPGLGLIIGLIGLTLLGFLTANLVGRSLIGAGEAILDRMPVVRSVYKGVKQVFETIFSQSGTSFRKVGMVQFPQPGMWSIVFIAQEAAPEIAGRLPDGQDPGDKQIGVFLPCTPNPTTGFFFYLPRREVVELSISVEDGAKLIMSAGLIQPGEQNGKPKLETKPPVSA